MERVGDWEFLDSQPDLCPIAVTTLYPLQVERLQQALCGKSRPHFFRGVATVSPC